MFEDCFFNVEIKNLEYRRMLRPSCLKDRINYLEYLINFYFKAIVRLKDYIFENEFRAEMSTTLQMMFTKAKMFRELLDGFSHSNGLNSLNNLVDHTVLFTIVRTAYEQLCAFELVCVLPDTLEKQIVLENAYVAAGLVNRRKMFTQDIPESYKHLLNQELSIIEDCKIQIHQTNLFQSLSDKSKESLDEEVFKKGYFQLYFSAEGKFLPHVAWDQVRNYCQLGTDTLNGVYRYACNMAHPSYLGLIQFRDAFKEDAMSMFMETATMQLSLIMSVFIMDYMNVYKMVKDIYEKLDIESRFMLCMYSQSLKEEHFNGMLV